MAPSLTKSLADALANPAIAPANPVVAPVNPVGVPANPVVALVSPVVAPTNLIVAPASSITTPAVVTRELTPTEIVYVDESLLRGRFNSSSLAVLSEVVGVEAGTQANEGDGLNFDDVYQKFGRRAKGASGQVYDIREVGLSRLSL
ncbi:hypothetical protein FRB95_003752 [Tulasnella sp. JGI-2019a]|nr:hypothetical protein FRB95_003752 [Tulasnella sp. JGI-2019a]